MQTDEPISGFKYPLIYNLAYCSRAVPGVDDAVVKQIVASSRRNNPRQGITGLLVFGSGVFFQWLEGPRDNVTQLMEVLRNDPRHDTVVRLSENEEMRDRLFPDWDMELVSTADIRDVLHDAMSAVEDGKNAAALKKLLKHLEDGPLQTPGK